MSDNLFTLFWPFVIVCLIITLLEVFCSIAGIKDHYLIYLLKTSTYLALAFCSYKIAEKNGLSKYDPYSYTILLTFVISVLECFHNLLAFLNIKSISKLKEFFKKDTY